MDAYFVSISRQTLYLTLVLTAPVVLAALVIGLIISLLQATTQVQEQTLTFVPKLVIVFVLLSLIGPWAFYQIMTFTHSMIEAIPVYVK